MNGETQGTEFAAPQRETFWIRTKKALGPVAVVGVVIAKFFAKLKFLILPALKFLPVLIKSGGTMLLSIGIYATIWGWKFAVGFVVLMFVHECGHLIVAKRFGLKVSAPVFIPFMGAFILLKDQPRNAWMEACVGIGGPMLGSLGALACHSLGETIDAPVFIALAYSGYLLNLFNLTPVGMLDGGRIVTALSRWLWLPGLAVLMWFGWKSPKFYRVADGAALFATRLFPFSQTDRRRTALLRSHTSAALDDIDLVFRSDCDVDLGNGSRQKGFGSTRSANSPARPRHDRAVIPPPLSAKDRQC